MYKRIALGTLAAGVFLFLGIGTSANLDQIKANADDVFYDAGFKVVGYEGYSFGTWIGGTLGGAKVWYILEKGSTTYNGFIQMWDGEYHIYDLKALNAVRGN